MSRSETVAQLRRAAPAIAPSLLLCDFANLEREVQRLTAAGCRLLHLDVMDGHFVPNLTYGLPLVETFRRLTNLPLDVHLMISQPGQYLRQFADAGADVMTIHAEIEDDPRELLEEIRSLDVAAGLAINPDTPLKLVADCLDACDLLLVMSVMPGFGGQAFEPNALEKLAQAREIGPPDLLLEVDGGVNAETIGDCVEAGAQLLVAGSAIFKHDDYTRAAGELTRVVQSRLVAMQDSQHG